MPSHAPHPLTALPFDAEAATPIQTERLTLRPLTVADADDVFAYQRRADVVKHLPWLVRSREESVEHTTTRSASTRLAKNGDALVLAMELPAAGGPGTPSRVIGDLSLFLRSVDNAQLEVGWVLHPDFHGTGYASEATTALLELCFGTLGAHRVRAELAPENTASAALCRRLGMRHEAHLVEFEVFKGAWGDLDIYAMLDSEWPARAQLPASAAPATARATAPCHRPVTHESAVFARDSGNLAQKLHSRWRNRQLGCAGCAGYAPRRRSAR